VANTKTFTRSFSGGELSAAMFGRIDDAKYQSGAAVLRNFIATPQGPAENRPGFEYVLATKNNGKARLIPFVFSSTQTMVLEFGEQYIRFHTLGKTVLSGAAPYEVATPYQAAHLFNIHYVQSADVMTLVHPKYPPMELRRLPDIGGNPNWTLTVISFGAVVDTPTNVGVTPSPGYLAQISSIESSSFNALITTAASHTLSLGDGIYINGVIPAFGEPIHDFYLVSDVPTDPSTGDLIKNQLYVMDYSGNPLNTTSWGGYTLSPGTIQLGDKIFDINTHYAVAALASDNVSQSLLSTPVTALNNLDVPGSYNVITWNSGAVTFSVASPTVVNWPGHNLQATDTVTFQATAGVLPTGISAGVSYNVSIIDANNFHLIDASGSFVNVTGAGSGTFQGYKTDAAASRYYIFKQKNGLWGFIGEAVGTSFTDNNIAPDFSITPVNLENPFSGADNYPAAVGYIEQRRCFAGTNNAPQTLWMTNSGTESTFAYSLPTQDTDRISVRVAAREVSSIAHIVPLTQLVLLTDSCEYAEFTANGGPITPSSIGIRPQSYIGASAVQPSVINSSLVYCAARGGHVRELGYSWQANGFVTGDLSLRSANLFDLLTITDQAFSKAPMPIVWFVSSNGNLLGLTYIPEQQIGAWHHHDTDGSFESICCVAEGNEERLYAVVNRTVKGPKTVVTFSVGSPTVVSWPAHGLMGGDPVTFLATGLLPAGISAAVSYKARVIDADHIQLQDASGNPIRVTDAGSGTIYGYDGFETVRYVERMASRLVGDLEDCFFVDAGDTFETQVMTVPITHITITSNRVTLSVGDGVAIPRGIPVALSGLTLVTDLNGQTVTGTSSSAGTFVFAYTHADVDGVETGQAVYDPPVTTISNIDWLEGATVAVLADGAVQNQKTVIGGSITLDHPANVIQFGLPYTSDLQTLPPTLQVDGFGQGRQLNVNKVWIRLFQSSGIFAGPSEDLLTEYKQRTTEVYGAPPDLQSGEAEITLMPQWNDNGQILLRQENPLPLTVVAVTMEMAIGG